MAVRLICIIVHTLIVILQRKTRRGTRGSGRKVARQAEYADNRGAIEPADMHNERFATYYQAQKIIPDHEWDTFMASLRQPLPTTFRIAGSRECGASPFTQERPVLTLMQG